MNQVTSHLGEKVLPEHPGRLDEITDTNLSATMDSKPSLCQSMEVAYRDFDICKL